MLRLLSRPRYTIAREKCPNINKIIKFDIRIFWMTPIFLTVTIVIYGVYSRWWMRYAWKAFLSLKTLNYYNRCKLQEKKNNNIVFYFLWHDRRTYRLSWIFFFYYYNYQINNIALFHCSKVCTGRRWQNNSNKSIQIPRSLCFSFLFSSLLIFSK